MSRLKGEINSEEKQSLEAKITDLKKTLEEKNSTFGLLEIQIKKLHVTYPKYFYASNILDISHSVLSQNVSKTLLRIDDWQTVRIYNKYMNRCAYFYTNYENVMLPLIMHLLYAKYITYL